MVGFMASSGLKISCVPWGVLSLNHITQPRLEAWPLQNLGWVALYVVGVLSCVYHLANGLWTMGITWGVWTSQAAQDRASKVCAFLGILLAVVSMVGLFEMRAVGQGEALQKAIQAENQMYEHKLEAGEIMPNEHKRAHAEEAAEEEVANAEQ